MVFPLPKPTRFRARSLFVLLLLPVLCSSSHAFTDTYGKLYPGFRSFLFGVAGGGAMYFYLKATKEQEGERGTLVHSDVDKSWSNSKIKLMSVTAGVTTWAWPTRSSRPKRMVGSSIGPPIDAQLWSTSAPTKGCPQRRGWNPDRALTAGMQAMPNIIPGSDFQH